MHAHHAGGVFGKVAHLALLGAGILFVGPIAVGLGAAALGVVVAILALLLPFVVIGGIGYAPYLLVRHMFGSPKQRPTLEVRRVLPEVRPFRPAAVEVPVERPAPPRERRVRGVVARVAAFVFGAAGGALGAVAPRWGGDWIGGRGVARLSPALGCWPQYGGRLRGRRPPPFTG